MEPSCTRLDRRGVAASRQPAPDRPRCVPYSRPGGAMKITTVVDDPPAPPVESCDGSGERPQQRPASACSSRSARTRGSTAGARPSPFPASANRSSKGFAPRRLIPAATTLEVQLRDPGCNPWLAPYENGYAVGAVDVALHDLWGKALGVPVHQLLRRRMAEARAWLRIERRPVPRGHRPEGPLARGGARARGARLPRDQDAGWAALQTRSTSCRSSARFGRPSRPTWKLMVDAWGSYTLPTALRVGRELQDMGFYWYEELLRAGDGYRAYEVLAAGARHRGRRRRDAPDARGVQGDLRPTGGRHRPAGCVDLRRHQRPAVRRRSGNALRHPVPAALVQQWRHGRRVASRSPRSSPEPTLMPRR